MEKGETMNVRHVLVEHQILAQTIKELRQSDRARTERFALWLGRRNDSQVLISEIYVPRYEASSDYFHISRPEMARLIAHLGERGLMIGAQLHTHPFEAFHSAADDRWAIVRHVSALSIVLPDFGRTTTSENFLRKSKVFALARTNEWIEIAEWDLNQYLRVTR